VADITVKELGRSIVISLHGELLMKNASEAEETLNEQADKQPLALAMDCSHLSSMDSSGLGLFIGLSKRLNEKGIELIICNLNDNIANIFDVSKLVHFFKLMTLSEFESQYK